jgi:sugar phosphate isomerase/epimerase
MYLGYNTNGFAHHRLDDTWQIIAELGYRAVGLTLDFHALGLPTDETFAPLLAKIRSLQERHRLDVLIETGARFLLDPREKHQPTLLSRDSGDRARRREFLEHAARVAGLLGAEVISFWSGTPLHAEAEECLLDRLTQECQLLCDRHPHLRWAFEPEPGMFIETMPQFERLFQQVNRVNFGLTLDVGHLYCTNELPVAPWIHRWASRLWNVHIEDMRRGVHDHLPFGEGEMDFAEIFHALSEINYSGGLFVELSRQSHDAVRTAKKSLVFLQPFLENLRNQPLDRSVSTLGALPADPHL